VIGWLLDTNVTSALINPDGAPSVKQWASSQPEETMFLSVLTLAEYDQGIHNLDPAHPDRVRYSILRDAVAARFRGRIVSVTDAAVRRWGVVSGEVRRRTGVRPAVIDTLLAASALERDLFLVTRNVKDVSDSGVAMFNPWLDDGSRFFLART
jgi:toxin FitB